MDLQKAKILLDKINALYLNMNADKKNISSIERDLMKSYIQQLYESFSNIPQAPVRKAVQVIKSTPKAKPTPPPAPVVVEKKAPPPPPPAPKPIPKPAPPKVEKKVPPPPPPPVEPKPAPPKPKPKPIPVAVKPPVAHTGSPELEELFDFDTAKELSEKLGEMPLTDIKKGMGLNDRIFTLNELFGGDQAVFDLTIDTLNKLPDYAQAKSFLMRNAASKYNWTAKGKKKKAKIFIKIVKRRYN